MDMFYLFMFSAAISRVHYLLLTEPSEFYLAYQSHCLALLTIFLRNPEYLFALVHLLPKHSRVLLFNGLSLLQTKQRKKPVEAALFEHKKMFTWEARQC